MRSFHGMITHDFKNYVVLYTMKIDMTNVRRVDLVSV